MSYLSIAGKRFKINFDRLSDRHLKHFEALNRKMQPEFMRPVLKPDLRNPGYIEKDPAKLEFLVGDRVVIVKGEKKGNICKVTRHVEGGGYLLDENGPQKQSIVPKQLWVKGQTSHLISYPLPLKKSDLRLVADIKDEATGKLKTVAVENLTFSKPKFNGQYKKMMPVRRVYDRPELVIPWPEPEHVEDGVQTTAKEDLAEMSLFVTHALKPLVPYQALKTLRNEHSKLRKRKIDARMLRKLTYPEMPVPPKTREISAKLAAIPRPPKVELTDAMKEFLSKKIIKHKETLKKYDEEHGFEF